MNLTIGTGRSGAGTSQMTVTRVEGDARQLTAEEYRKVRFS
jgi:hypothetical protein